MRAALAARPKSLAPDDDRLAFVTPKGLPWTDKRVTTAFEKLRQKTGLFDTTPGFYGLRHTFVTQARKVVADPDAIRMITGHVTSDDDMLSSVYDEDWNDVEPERIVAAAKGVRDWLLAGIKSAVGESANGEFSEAAEDVADVLPFAAVEIPPRPAGPTPAAPQRR